MTNLPNTLQEVEYIQSSGDCRIDTGAQTNGTYFKIDTKINFLSFSSDTSLPYIFGPVDGGQCFIAYDGNGHIQYGAGNADIIKDSISANTDYSITAEWNSGVLTTNFNGSSATDTYTGGLSTHVIPIFCRRRNNNTGYNCYSRDLKIYYFKMYSSSNTLVRDLVPCYRIADGEIGMYDLVNDVFYTNAGTGTFTKGADVISQKKITNLTLNGESYEIREYTGGGGGGGYTPNANTIVYLPLATNADDVTENYTPIPTNITFNDGKAVFNNSGTSCITLPATMTHTTFTLHMIVQMTDDTGYQILYRQSNNIGYNDSRCYLTGYGNGIRLTMDNISSDVGYFADYNEHMYSFVVTNNSIKFYVDGGLKYTMSGTLGSYANAQLSFGNRFYNMNEGLKGTMREVILENATRTDAEVEALAQEYGFTPSVEPQTEECHVCEGTGEVDCDMCGGSGEEMCPLCAGTGQVGDPEDPETREECPECNGSGFITCGNCGGTGKMTCEWCGGTGEEPEPQTEECHVCEGTGEVDCDMCGGSGEEMCTICQGGGQVGDPEDPETREECPECNGSGFITCGNCGGTGMMTCEWCGGTGEEPLP